MRISGSILLISALVLLPTNMTSDVVSDLIQREQQFNCTEEAIEQGALKGKIAEVWYRSRIVVLGTVSRVIVEEEALSVPTNTAIVFRRCQSGYC